MVNVVSPEPVSHEVAALRTESLEGRAREEPGNYCTYCSVLSYYHGAQKFLSFCFQNVMSDKTWIYSLNV